MSSIKDTREQAGLSLKDMANLLGISKTMIFLMEKGKRHLSTDNIFKLAAIQQHLNQTPTTEKIARTGRVVFTDPIKMGELHRKKMENHRKLAAGFKKQLEKLQDAMPGLEKQAALRELMKNLDVPGYRSNKGDQLLLEIVEMQSKSPAKLLAEQEELQDKIDTHLAYADLHQQRWGMFVEMG